ncbi:M24 family metallopeptidase [Youngiibacter fragilis]|uniref:Proline dipeptidase n=1 Tax=Youngiibacter fragilis 232.1 TaxID=994573 RepID=V7I6N3_9CLOT|nr:aminopeptidase P family protein [Youngiibacter fragilis]ETA80869.1 proline dipeptidase [Youngiibacter fragilis 232.1]
MNAAGRRLGNTIDAMKGKRLTQIIVSDPSSILYLTGKDIHPGERLLALLLREEGIPVLFINELFPTEEAEGLEIVWLKDTSDGIGIMAEYIVPNKPVGIDKTWPSGFLISLMEKTGSRDFVNSSPIVDRIRAIKDEEETRLMEEASRLNDKAMEMLVGSIGESHTEKDLARLLSEIYEELGTEGFSFEPIIAFGPNGADPHHSNGSALLKAGDSIIIDIGCRKDGYCADMTRTVFWKEIPERSREVYETVLEANIRAIDMVRPGVRFCDVDQAARGFIEEKGFGRYFTHRTGHSIGLDVHEAGDVSSANTSILEPGMVFSVEPGIYLQGDVGVRIEDLVLVTEDGHKVINSYTKEIMVIGTEV